MGDHSSDFLNQFYKLEGVSISDIKKKFFKFLRQPTFAANIQEVHDALDKLEPKNYLQGLLKIEALIHFRKADTLLEHLQKGTNEIYISKIIKQTWFLEEVFGSFDTGKFVNEFLPQTSFALRMKLIKKMAKIWHEETVDKFYDEILKRYGTFVANIVLDKCSPKKLEQVFVDNDTILTPNQVIQLCQRDIDLFKLYVLHYKKLKGKYDEKKVFDYVALKNPEVLLDLQKQEIISYVMGRRITKKLFPLIKDDIENAELYLKFMEQSILVRRWGDKFPDIYQKLFPTDINTINIYNKDFQLLKFYPKNRRWPLFLKVFSDNIGIEKLPKAYLELNNRFLTICHPTKEAIQMWASENYKTHCYGYLDYLKYYETPVAITMLKETIDVTADISKRETLLKLMISACAEHNDLNALEGVLKYICVRHRNEEHYVKQNLLGHVKDSFKMETLTESHWQYINEQMNVLRAQKKHDSYVCKELSEYYLEFLYINKKPYKEILILYIKDVVNLTYGFDLSLKDPSVMYNLYKEFLILYPTAIKLSEQKYREYFVNLIQAILKFGKGNQKYFVKLEEFTDVKNFASQIFVKSNKFDTFDFQFVQCLIEHNILSSSNAFDPVRLLQAFRKMYVTGSFHFPFYVYEKCIMKKNRSDFENKILKLYFEIVFDHQSDQRVIEWFLLNEPSVLVPYFLKIIEKLVSMRISNKNMLVMKYYPQLDMDKNCSKFYKSQLDNLDKLEDNEVAYSMQYLALLLTADEFVAIVNDKFLPKKGKLDLEDEEMSQFYKAQCGVIEKLHSVLEPVKLLPVVMKFCVGDYLKSALPALYSLFYRCPEQLLYDKLDSLSKGAVSVKKHALFLSCQVLDSEKITKLFLASSSLKSSEQKHVFSSLFKYFMKNPSPSLFDLVIKNLYTIDKNDTEVLDKLKDAQIPKKYKVQFLEECWSFFESLKTQDVKITSYLNSLLYDIVDCGDTIEKLSTKFIDKILRKYFQDVDEDLANIEQFICRILRYRVSEQLPNFKIVFNILKGFSQAKRYDFFCEFDAINRDDVDLPFIQEFNEYWNQHLPIKDAFRETVGLQLLLFHHLSESSQIYAQNIVTYMEQLLCEYGPYTLTLYAQILEKHVNSIDQGKVYQLYLDILSYKNNVHTCTLILMLMNNTCQNKKYEQIYNEVRQVLASSDDKFVQIYYKNFI